ncbi:single-stranded DNA-binding protein [Bifidobacterium olomucense]|uniref:Single-stranded DNA-binding protein n=1 Tax=Bifidobacterium olomucense TaxID=2675324 RepID=A0A7Y0EXV3_9BIFI|nr:single-stranded DNA-binding protein [Bifidobacterium sp. DSM 109959]NMM97346.1 single-stranded DNA-binding protein [Bifidobacterium sp. DSM 109959]
MANQQAAVTVTGFVASDLVKGGKGDFTVLTFRMGSTRSRLNPNTRQWEEFGTAWLTVKAFRSLANNALQSIRRGDRIIVVGVLNTEQWNTEQGELRSRTILEATNIGHDLTFGTTNLTKTQRANSGNASGSGNAGTGAAGAGNSPSGGGAQDPASGVVAASTPTPPVELGDAGVQCEPSGSQPLPADVVDGSDQLAMQQSYADGFTEEPEM